VIDDHDVVGQFVCLVEILRGQQHRGALANQIAHEAPHIDASTRIEAGGGLIENEHLRSADKACAEIESATHAA
jgi:hypothetical protein